MNPLAPVQPPAPNPASAFVGYRGGRVLANVNVVAVYWGPRVSSTVTYDLPGFYDAVTNSPYLDLLAQYDTQVAGGTDQNIGRGSFGGAVTIAPGNTSRGLADTDIRAELGRQIDAGALPAPNADTLFMVHFPPGIVITTNGATSCQDFCSYHSSFFHGGQSIAYGVVPDYSAGSGCDSGCGSSTQFNNTTTAASHEMIEAITDADVTAGWWSSTYNEIGDICAGQQTTLPGIPYTVQKAFSNAKGACIAFNAGRTYQVLDLSDVVVLGANGNLWLEHGPFGTVPPPRHQIDGNALTFQALDSSNVLVLGRDAKLWFEHGPFGSVPPPRQQIDGNVMNFQAVDSQNVVVLGWDRNLWLEHAPFGVVPPAREQIDGGVLSYQALDSTHVLVLGGDGNLWYEVAPFGVVPPIRQQIDAQVRAFRAIDSGTILVLTTDGTLWLEFPPFGAGSPSARAPIDTNVRSFQPIDAQDVFVLDDSGNLWFERAPFGSPPPNRQQVDFTASTFTAFDAQHVLVLGFDAKLWLEQAPFGGVIPPSRQQIDGNVQP
jgi:hypothetical protein